MQCIPVGETFRCTFDEWPEVREEFCKAGYGIKVDEISLAHGVLVTILKTPGEEVSAYE